MEQRRFANDESSDFSKEFLPENYSLSPVSNSLLCRNSSQEGSGSINPNGFIGDGNQFLHSDLSRLSLSQSTFEHQNSLLRFLTPGVSVGEKERQEADHLRGSCYSTAGYGDQGVTNAGLRRGLMGFHNGGQDLSGVHQHLIMVPRVMNNRTGASPLRGGGAFTDSVRGNDFLMQNCPPDSGSNLREYSFLPSKKYLPEGFNDQFSNVSAAATENFSDFLWSKNRSFLRSNSGGNHIERTSNFENFEGYSLQDLRGRIVSLAQDEKGSRMLQEKLKKPNEVEIEMVVSEVVVYADVLMNNQFGSHFFQKIFGSSSEEQRTKIVRTVTENSHSFVSICTNPHGACTIKSFLDNLITPEQISMVVIALCHSVVELANDSNGQYVVMQCLMKYSHEYIKYLLNEIADNFIEIATNKSGCVVLQLSFDNSQGETKNRLIKHILTNALRLACDPFGNYVLQHLMNKNIPGINANLYVQLQSKFLDMSMDKYASHVVEKLLVQSDVEHSQLIINQLINHPNSATLLTDPFANYVIQKALFISEGYELQILCSFIKRHDSSMRGNRYGQKILSFLDKKIRDARRGYHP